MQAAALSEGLVAQFVADTVAEPDQEWIRQPMPLGIRTAEHGNSALVRVVREGLGNHHRSDRLRDELRSWCSDCLSRLVTDASQRCLCSNWRHASVDERFLTDVLRFDWLVMPVAGLAWT